MIIPARVPYPPLGKVTNIRFLGIGPSQPAMFLREATKQEFLDYWKDNLELQEAFKAAGPQPDDVKFYEVSTD